jgi:DNA-binding CsgD family transcriptional regulator
MTILSPELEQKIVELRAQNLSQRAIAEKLGVDRQVIRTAYKKLDIEGLPYNDKITPEIAAFILKSWASGTSIPQLAEKLGLNRSSIQDFMHRQGVDISNKVLTPEKEQQILQLRSEGKGYKSIAKTLGCSCGAIRNFLGKVE